MRAPITAGLIARLVLLLILIALSGISARPHVVDQALQEARRFQELGLSLQAAEAVARAGEHTPWRNDLWELAGNYALQGGDPLAAGSYFTRAAQWGNLTPSGQVAYGDALLKQGDLEGAVQVWNGALQAGGPPEELHLRLAEAFQQLGDFPAAIQHLEALVGLEPEAAHFHYQLGLLLAATQPESAMAVLSRAAELDPELASPVSAIQRSLRTARLGDDPAYHLVASGRALAALDEWDLAAQAFQQATQARPDYAEAWAFLGEARQQLGEDGLAELQKAVKLDPNSISANMFLALYWQRREKPDLALDYLHAAAGLDPRNPALKLELGNTLAMLGRISEALAYYQRATELAPRDPAYWRALANFSVKYEFLVSEVGLPAAQEALSLEPDNPASLDTLGQVYMLLEDYENAQRYLESAVQKEPEYAPAHLHLGLLSIIQGDSRSANVQLNKALALADPDSPAAEQAQRLLEQYFP